APAATGDMALVCTGDNALPLHITIELSTRRVRQLMENEPGVMVTDDVSSAEITADTISWFQRSLDGTCVYLYTLDRKSNHLISSFCDSQLITREYDCH